MPARPAVAVPTRLNDTTKGCIVMQGGGGAGSRTRVRKCSTRDSTCVARALSSLRRRARGRAHRATSRSCCLVARRSALRDDQPTHDVRSGPQAQPGRRPRWFLGSESKRVVVRVSVLPPFLRGLAASSARIHWRHIPRRSRFAPFLPKSISTVGGSGKARRKPPSASQTTKDTWKIAAAES